MMLEAVKENPAAMTRDIPATTLTSDTSFSPCSDVDVGVGVDSVTSSSVTSAASTPMQSIWLGSVVGLMALLIARKSS